MIGVTWIIIIHMCCLLVFSSCQSIFWKKACIMLEQHPSMTVVRADGDIVFVGWLAWPGPFVTRDSQAALREMREMRCKCHKDAR